MVSICRLCASLKKTENLTFVRDKNQDLCIKILKCCQVIIELNDALPRGVCPECVRCLNASFEFYEKVKESQQSLEKLFKSSTGKDSKSSEQNELLVLKSAAVSTEEATKPDKVITDETNVQNADDNPLEQTEHENQIDEEVEESEENYEANFNAFGTSGTEIKIIGEEDLEKGELDPGEFEIFEIDDNESIDLKEELTVEDGFISEDVEDADDIEVEEDDSMTSRSLIIQDLNATTWIDYQWKCNICAEKFTSVQDLLVHYETVEKIRNEEINWQCFDCLKDFPRYYTLINHVRQRHRRSLALFCDICNEKCESFKHLKEHRETLHKDDKIYFHLFMIICEQCGKCFNTMNSLQIHSKVHLPDVERLRHKCKICEKKFRSRSNLKFHERMHAGNRQYVCHHCGKKFFQKANLEEHLVTHVTLHPYECDVCNKCFKTPERLTKHKRCHTDEKPFSCEHCDKTFRTKDAMNSHNRTHTGEMPFQCEFCEKQFRFRSTLMTHTNIHTGVRPYSCLDCNHHFTNWPNYNKHMKRRHGIDVSSRNKRGPKGVIPGPVPSTSKKTTNKTTTHSNIESIEEEEIQYYEVDVVEQISETENENNVENH